MLHYYFSFFPYLPIAMCYILRFHQYIWHFISLQEFEKKSIYQRFFFFDPDTFHSLWHFMNFREILIIVSQILPIPLLLFLGFGKYEFCQFQHLLQLDSLCHLDGHFPFLLGTTENSSFKALLKLLSSSVVLNSAVRLSGLRALLFFNNWILLLTSGAIMLALLSAVFFSSDWHLNIRPWPLPSLCSWNNSEKNPMIQISHFALSVCSFCPLRPPPDNILLS